MAPRRPCTLCPMAIETETTGTYAPPSQAESWVFFDGEYRRYQDVHLGLMTHALHYGTGCFEGIRAYWSETQEQLFCLLLEPHFARLVDSARILRIELP